MEFIDFLSFFDNSDGLKWVFRIFKVVLLFGQTKTGNAYNTQKDDNPNPKTCQHIVCSVRLAEGEETADTSDKPALETGKKGPKHCVK